MKKGYAVNKQGMLDILQTELDIPKSEVAVSFSHLVFKKIRNYFLVIDTFNDHLDLISADLKEEVFDNSNTNHPSYAFYASRYSKNMDGIKDAYLSTLDKKKCDALHTFLICPTYKCNSRCIYCYQQYDTNLDRSTMTQENLNKVFSYISSQIDNVRELNSDQPISIGLFGGEPFMSKNKDIIERVFKYARSKKILLSATTNLQELGVFLDLFLTYRGYIGRICTTIDGKQSFHNSRRKSLISKDPFSLVVDNINTLIKIGISVSISINIDKNNADQLLDFFEVAKANDWIDNPYVYLEIGRVDDRLFEGTSDSMFMESDLLNLLINFNKSHGFPNNVKLAFLKSSHKVAERFGFLFGQNETGRVLPHYCWSSTPLDNVQYIDSNLDIYRCTYTVGNKNYTIGSVESKQSLNLEMFGNSIFSDAECANCPIGGYCGGGCSLSCNVNKSKLCEEEFRNFDSLINNVVIPMVEEQLCFID